MCIVRKKRRRKIAYNYRINETLTNQTKTMRKSTQITFRNIALDVQYDHDIDYGDDYIQPTVEDIKVVSVTLASDPHRVELMELIEALDFGLDIQELVANE